MAEAMTQHAAPDAERVEALALERVRALKPYVPGLQPAPGEGWLKLNTNEWPYPPSPRVAEAIAAEVEQLPYYPQPTSLRLREAIAAAEGLQGPDWVLAGNGSDDCLNLLLRAFCDARAAAGSLEPTYGLYAVLAAIQGTPFHTVPLPESLELPVATLAALPCRLLFVPHPHAPLGRVWSLDALQSLAERFSGILVIDEAYIAFAGPDASARQLLERHPRLVITRTFSKSHGLAGLRVGFCLAHPALIGLLDRVRESYNLDRLAQAGARAALEDTAYYAPLTQRIVASRERFCQGLDALGWAYAPTGANFVFAEPPGASPERAKQLYEALAAERVLVRHFPRSALTSKGLRMSVGTEGAMEQLLDRLSTWTQTHA